MPKGKNILLGVCGSIAAYKSTLLVRLLIKAGYQVQVVMTDAAKTFVGPLTLSTLSKRSVPSQFLKNDQGEWENHVDLALWANLILIAPASVHTIAKFSHGLCDNLLSAIYLSAKCPIALAPAMDLDMYQHPTTIANIARLREYGNLIIDAEHGELASGLVGEGRMAEPVHIFEFVNQFFTKVQRFKNKKILITAGPTYEKIDPVRFIGNHSSGKMGLALAQAFANEGAVVQLVAGPGNYTIANSSIELISVSSADNMYAVVKEKYETVDIAIFAAAVSDYKPIKVATEKIKKSNNEMTLTLVKNKDIAAEMGVLKKNNQINVGFALETENEEQYALKKMKQKNFDLIVLNSLNDAGAGFSVDTNKITIFKANQTSLRFALKSKAQVSEDILNCVYDEVSS